MRVIITRSTFVRGELVEAGPDPIDLEKGDAKTLLDLKKAVLPPEPEPEPEPEPKAKAEAKKPAQKKVSTKK